MQDSLRPHHKLVNIYRLLKTRLDIDKNCFLLGEILKNRINSLDQITKPLSY